MVSHNDSDHTGGVCELLNWLKDSGKYTVRVFTHQYLKYVDKILDTVDDGRRDRESLKNRCWRSLTISRKSSRRQRIAGLTA